MTIRAYWVSLSYFDQQLLPYLAPDHTPLGVRVEVLLAIKPAWALVFVGVIVIWHRPN